MPAVREKRVPGASRADAMLLISSPIWTMVRLRDFSTSWIFVAIGRAASIRWFNMLLS